ncbi:hypothetical protein AA100600_2844 [Gluconobacter thailandicus F149-1 = NBRC 100600]|nr:hypothetical protein AA100600_2844 [Gluconobacter thailandicus F149-1 = NBRC 100600]
MQPADNAFFNGEALIVLNEGQVDAGLCHAIKIIGFGKEAAIIAETRRRNENDFWNGEPFNLHDGFLQDMRSGNKADCASTEKTLPERVRQRREDQAP